MFDNPSTVFKDAHDATVDPHFLLKLGPPMTPHHVVPNGPKIKQAARVWCMLDLLLTSKTISEAMDETKKRLGGDSSGDEELQE